MEVEMEIFSDLAMSRGATVLMPVVWWALVFCVVTSVFAWVSMPGQQLVWSRQRLLSRARIHEGLLSLSVGSAVLVILLCAAVIVQFMLGVHIEM